LRLAIIGGGIVGLSIGIAALNRGIDSVTIFEKEVLPGLHASSRNSGVLHSGIYYSADSLKARFSLQGNAELRRRCVDANIPILESGKLIVSRDEESEDYLSTLMNRAEVNGVEARRMPQSEIRLFEPRAKTFESFIYVSRTAVASPRAVFKTLVHEYETLGGQWVVDSKIKDLRAFQNREVKDGKAGFDLVVNAAGALALDLAKTVGVGRDLLVTPFLGLYWGVPQEELPLRIPIYPTPHPINPFLGVHLTPTVSGLTKIGPTAIPVLGREQYTLFSAFKPSDSLESVRALSRIALGKKHSLVSMIASELPKFIRSNMVREAVQLFDGVGKVRGWQAVPGGIRAQLVNAEGELVQDFMVEKSDGIVHVLNAVSPGWTSALPFGRWIVDNFVIESTGQ
jgi:L-2-hydroxyglutarate oxidase LhgO